MTRRPALPTLLLPFLFIACSPHYDSPGGTGGNHGGGPDASAAATGDDMSIPQGGGGGGGGGVGGNGPTCKVTCAQLGANCGPQGDGCGGMIDCGSCSAPDSCGGGGMPSVCGHTNGGPCTPMTCAQLGASCGPQGDGCGGMLGCGSCMAPDICGGGGMPSVCGGGNPAPPCTGLCNNQVHCDGGSTTLSGTVYAPTNPLNGYGNPDPLYNALVYVPNSAVMPFLPGVSCGQCSAQASGSPLVSATTGPDGKFTLVNAPAGNNIPLVIQIGRWRRQIVIPQVKPCTDNPLTPDQTRLPRNKSEGDIPHIAIVTGQADPIECVLPKIGIDASEFTLPSGNGRVHIYQNNGASLGGGTPAQSALVGSPTTLAQYDMVIFDCINHVNTQSTGDQKNIVGYTSAGGRVFASHYSYAWLAGVAPLSSTAAWNTDQSAPPDLNAFIDTTTMKGKDFSSWLTIVQAATTPGQIPVQQVRHDLDAVNAPSQQWMYSDPAVSPNNPLEYTFDTPVGNLPANQCGRVLFSDFHVNTGGSGSGTFPGECGAPAPMTPQEKVLEFMLFDLSSCIAPNLPPPPPTCTPLTCAQQHLGCGPAGDGCGHALDCGMCVLPNTCGGGGTPAQCGHTGTCTPLTCAQQGYNCGPAGDGCGHALDCGMCTPPQTCGGGGKPGVCGGVIP